MDNFRILEAPISSEGEHFDYDPDNSFFYNLFRNQPYIPIILILVIVMFGFLIIKYPL